MVSAFANETVVRVDPVSKHLILILAAILVTNESKLSARRPLEFNRVRRSVAVYVVYRLRLSKYHRSQPRLV